MDVNAGIKADTAFEVKICARRYPIFVSGRGEIAVHGKNSDNALAAERMMRYIAEHPYFNTWSEMTDIR